jgi:predicted metal-binding protein
MEDYHLPICTHCYAVRVEPNRIHTSDGRKILRPVCAECGEALARQELKRKASMCQPINKSAPTYISDPTMLFQLNPKRTS